MAIGIVPLDWGHDLVIWHDWMRSWLYIYNKWGVVWCFVKNLNLPSSRLVETSFAKPWGMLSITMKYLGLLLKNWGWQDWSTNIKFEWYKDYKLYKLLYEINSILLDHIRTVCRNSKANTGKSLAWSDLNSIVRKKTKFCK